MKRLPLLLAASALALTLGTAACNRADAPQEQQQAGKELGIVPASMDKAVAPGDDFFMFANGSWVKNTPIPEDRSSIGAFYLADQEREKASRELLDNILKS